MLELAGQCKGNDELVDETLNGRCCNHANEHSRPGPGFKEEHDFEDGEQYNDSYSVRNGSENSTEFLAAHAEDGSHTAGHAEENTSNTCVDGDWSSGNNGESQDGIRRFRVITYSSPGVDVEIRNQRHSNKY